MTNTIPNQGGMVAWFTGESSIANFADKLPALGKGLKGFATATEGINTESVTAASNAAKTLAQMTNTIPSEGGIKSWFTGESSIANFSDKLPKLGKGLSGFAKEVAGINAENVTAAAGAAKSLAQMVSVIPPEGGIKAWFTGESSVSNFANKLPALGKGLKGFSESVKGINPENITAAANAAKSLAKMASTAPKDTSKIITFGDNLVKFGGKLKSYFEKTKGINSESINASSNAIKAVKSSTTGLNPSNLKSAASAISELVKSLKSMSSVSEKSVSGFTNAMKKLGQTNVKAVIDAFKNAGPKLASAGKEAISKLSEGVKSQNSKVKTAGQESAKKLAEGMKAQSNYVKSACKSLVSACTSAMSTYKMNFYNSGANLAKGFASGISAYTWMAEAKSRAMANAAARAAKKALDEHSPSRVFYGIGDYAGQGFVNALGDYAKKAYSASSDMAGAARSGLSDAISRVNDIFNSDVGSQPTITPVLDLSEVSAGVGAINGMFGTPSVGVLSQLGRVNTRMNGYNQNGGTDEVISAINKLRKEIANMDRNSYNINGITYDNGSEISNAIESLIRAAQIERRI